MAELRALAFEMAAALPSGSLERLQNLPIDLSFAAQHLGGEIALIDDAESHLDGDPNVQTRRMLLVFRQIVEGRRTAAAAARDAINAARMADSCVDAVATYTTITTEFGEVRPALWRMTSDGFERAATAISVCCRSLRLRRLILQKTAIGLGTPLSRFALRCLGASKTT